MTWPCLLLPVVSVSWVQSKLHSISEAVEGFVRQGMPALLMARIKALTDKNLNGRSDLEVELEVERQKAAECLHFLYYQVGRACSQ